VNTADQLSEEQKMLATADGYAVARLGLPLYPWQMDVARAVSRRGSRVAVRTCNESGKTSTLLVALILWHMETQMNSLTITTSGSYRQIKDQLYPHLRVAGNKLGPGWEFGDGWGKYEGTGARLVSFSTDDPGKAEGWHEPPGSTLMIIMDEAKTPPQEIYDSFERCHASYWVNLSSPGGASGPFYDCFHKFAKRWETFHVRAMDCPHLWDNPVKRAEIEGQMQVLRPELVQSMIYGDFMPAGSGQLFDMHAVDACMSGEVQVVGEGQYRCAAYDGSGGSDEQVLAFIDGNRTWFGWTGHERDTDKTVVLVGGHVQRAGLDMGALWSDLGGEGARVNQAFEKKYGAIRPFDFGGRPADPAMYLNARAEAYFRLSDLIRLRRISLPDDEALREELAFIRYEPDSSPIKLVEKRKFPRSPNRADALAMLVWQLEYEQLILKPDDHSDLTSPTRRRRDRDECAAGPWDQQ